MSIDSVSWIFVGLSLLGNFYVIRKNVVGQWLWAVSNVGWVAFDLYKGMYSQAFLFGIYFIMCVWGIMVWSKEAKTKTESSLQNT